MRLEPPAGIPEEARRKIEEADFLRCKCGKIVCQVNGDEVIIKCRHCKRFIVIRTKGISTVEFH